MAKIEREKISGLLVNVRGEKTVTEKDHDSACN